MVTRIAKLCHSNAFLAPRVMLIISAIATVKVTEFANEKLYGVRWLTVVLQGVLKAMA